MGGPEPLPKARNALRILNGDNALHAYVCLPISRNVC